MGEKNRLLILIAIMASIVSLVEGITLYSLYTTSFEQQKVQLTQTVKQLAKLIEAVSHFDEKHSQEDHPEGAEAATLSQVKHALEHSEETVKDNQVILVRRKGAQVELLFSSHQNSDHGHDSPPPPFFSLTSEAMAPMRHALMGDSGTHIGVDYRDHWTLAAFEPIHNSYGWALIGQAELSSIREPFIRIALITMGISLLAILLGARLFQRIVNPLIVDLRSHRDNLTGLLGEAESRMEDAIESLPVGFSLWDAEDHLLLFNNTLQEFFPKSVTPLKPGMSFQQVFLVTEIPEKAPMSSKEQELALEERYQKFKQGKSIEETYPDGRSFVMHHRATSEGGTVVIRINITERKKAENRIKENEQNLEQALDLVPFPMGISSRAEGRYLRVNQAHLDFHGISRADLPQQLTSSIFANSGERKEIFHKLRAEGMVKNLEVQFKRLQTKTKSWCLLSVHPITYFGEPALISIYVDITERKQSEALQSLETNLIHQTTQVAAGAEKFDETLGQCLHIICELADWPIGHVYVLNEDKDLLVSSTIWHFSGNEEQPEFQELTEKTTFAHGIGLPGRIWATGEPSWIVNVQEDKNFPRAQLCKKLAIKSAFGFPLKTQSGLVAILEFFSSDEITPNSHFLQTIRLVGDQVGLVLERRETEIDLKSAKETAEFANRAKSEFLTNMSHEIRTPMNAILGFAEILDNEIQDPKHREYLSAIRSSSRSLMGLINDILDLSKVEAGKLELEYSVVNPLDVFQSMQQIFSNKIAEKGLSFHVDISDDLPKALLLDEMRLRQVLMNLLSNAIKFTNSGGIHLSVGQRFSPEDPGTLQLLFSVKDTGIGIHQDQMGRIFNAFEQQEQQSQAEYGGTGLGLTITKRLVEMMGGEISVESKPEMGSTFSVILKEIDLASINGKPESKKEEPSWEQIHFAPATLLIVDDVKLNHTLIRGFLQFPELAILEAENGKQGVMSAKRNLPDLILMDLRMPVMDGQTAALEIRKDSRLKAIPIVALTAFAMKQEDHPSSVWDAYLIKPVRQRSLLDTLKKFLKHSIVVETDSPASDSPEIEMTDLLQHMPVLNEEICQKLPELLQQLESDYGKSWQTFTQSLELNAIEHWGEGIKGLGENYAYPPLIEWGKRLQTQAQLIDIEALPKTLEAFPHLVEQLKQLISTD